MKSDEADLSEEELDKAYEGLHMHYKYGYGPDGSIFKIILSKFCDVLFTLAVIAIPTLILIGIVSLIMKLVK